jgi:hypothetical protein
MIEAPEEMELLDHIAVRCTCNSVQRCSKCDRTAEGFVFARADALDRLINIGYVTYEKGLGFVATEAGHARYDRMRRAMDRIKDSAGVSAVLTSTPQEDSGEFYNLFA